MVNEDFFQAFWGCSGKKTSVCFESWKELFQWIESNIPDLNSFPVFILVRSNSCCWLKWIPVECREIPTWTMFVRISGLWNGGTRGKRRFCFKFSIKKAAQQGKGGFISNSQFKKLCHGLEAASPGWSCPSGQSPNDLSKPEMQELIPSLFHVCFVPTSRYLGSSS